MRKVATFQWTVTVEVPNDLDLNNEKHMSEARHDAYLQVQENNSDLIEIDDEEDI